MHVARNTGITALQNPAFNLIKQTTTGETGGFILPGRVIQGKH
jgi:hypothetical protein